MRKIGYDLGSSSLGWYVSEDNETIKKGVVTFDTGMSKGQSGGYVSPTKDRREARAKRNLIRARKYRKWKLLKVLILNDYVPLSIEELDVWSKYKKGQVCKFPENELFLKWLACDFTYLSNGIKYKNPYELRVKALDNKLHKHEFGRALYHLVQRRGYKDIGETDAETEKQIARRGESGFQKALDKNRTIAEALTNEFLNKNQRARNQYPYRDEYRHELETICKQQGFDISKNDKGIYNDVFVQNLWKAIIWQRPLRTQKGNIGKCTLEPKKLRCPISNPIFEIFRAWQFINTIKTIDEEGQKQPLEDSLRNELFEELLKKDSNFKFEEIRKFIDKKTKKSLTYNYPQDKDGNYDTSVSGMPVCKGLISLFGEKVKKSLTSIEIYNVENESKKGGFGNAPKIVKDKYSVFDLWHAIFNFDKQFLEKFAVEKLGVSNVTRKKKGEEVSVSPLVELKNKFLQGYADLSLNAMCKILPFLKQGYLYNEAVVLAKIPDLLQGNWQEQKGKIDAAIKEANKIYNWNKMIVEISNSLIDKWKGDKYFADKDYTYKLQNDDVADVEKCVINYFGDKWNERQDKEKVIESVKEQYQSFFYDQTRAYRKLTTLTETFGDLLNKQNIHIDSSKLYHHSNLKNRYTQKCKVDKDTEKPELPIAKNKDGYDVEILPPAIVDCIKNPMFNKAMSILRKLTNELIKDNTIDSDTEAVVELARELNDNNKRIAIERYQKERENNRTKYRAFLQEFKEKENHGLNVEGAISTFELWAEQIFEETEDDKKRKVTNKNRIDILKEKDDIKRYELWLEQKGQCMYTGKMISISKLFSNEIDIMHTIPRSLLPDNTMANITVGYASYNRDLQKQKFPTQCDNYKKDVDGWGTSIEPRIEKWKTIRDNYKKLYESRQSAKGNEDENAKNKRIQDKHYYKLHYDYWKDKVERFEATNVSEKWARRQLTDTQMISKYAREFLKTYFKKVSVQNGSTTAVFRKIFGLQEQDEIKDRAIHTHHAIDAFVLTLVPTNSSYRDTLIKDYYDAEDKGNKAIDDFRKRVCPQGLNVQKIKSNIENTTLIFNYEKDNILKQTGKIVRKRGKIQYLKDHEGNYILKDGKKILLKAKGNTVRSSLFAQTYLGKIREVERGDIEKEIKFENLNGLKIKVKGLPTKRIDGDWQYKTGKDEFSYVVRKPIKDVISKIDDIVDPCIRELVRAQKNKAEIRDYQGNVIRHVRIKVKAGREVKERVNYRSKYDYKNKFYSESKSIPYAILLQKDVNGELERKMIPITSCEIVKSYRQYGKFDIEQYIKDKEEYSDYTDWNKTLLKVGQRVFVLKDDKEFAQRKNVDFQKNRLYVITQFSEGNIWLNYHLNAQSTDEIKKIIGLKKDELLRKSEEQFGLSEIVEDRSIDDAKSRKEDYENRKYRFDTINNSYRLTRIAELKGIEKAKSIKQELDKYKAIPSTIELEGETPLLKISSWNFLMEGFDFEMNFDGSITFLNHD